MTRIDYSSWDRRNHPRRRWVLTLAAVASAVLIVSAVVVFYPFSSKTDHAGAASESHGVNRQQILIRPHQLTLGVCIDPTSSIASSFATTIRGDLDAALGTLAPAKQVLRTDSGTPSQPMVDLTVRQVSTWLFSTVQSRYIRHFVIPGIPGLARARPGPTAPASQLRTWYSAYDSVKSARIETTKAAASAASELSTMPLERGGWSGISGCVSGLLQTVPSPGTHSYLLASDLQDNIAPQLAGSFRGAPLLIIQACDTGKSAYCEGLLKHFLSRMQKLDVGQVTVVRLEVAGEAINEWIHTGNGHGH